MKLWVVGETSPNPEEWGIWSEFAIVVAETAEQACELGDGTPATEIPIDKAQRLVKMPEPAWGDDL